MSFKHKYIINVDKNISKVLELIKTAKKLIYTGITQDKIIITTQIKFRKEFT